MEYITSQMSKIESLKKQIEELLPMKVADEKRLKMKFRLEFNYNSNHLEGNTLTYGQTQLLLISDKISGDVPLSDVEEMKAHDVALSLIEELAKDAERPLTEQFIKELNKLILVRAFWKDAVTADGSTTRKKIEIGTYKTSPNSVRLRNGEIHEYASPEETPAKMDDLMIWYNENKTIMPAPQLAAEFHYRFVCIHPFDDGNGRVARLLMNYILLKKQYPPVIIKSEDKENYLTALQKADLGYIVNIIEYIEKQLVWSLNITLKAAKGENIEESADMDKEIEILKREKLTNAKDYKSPKVCYNLINFFYENIYIYLEQSIYRFSDFFEEIKTSTFVNNIYFQIIPFDIKQVVIVRNKIEHKPYEIYGIDLDEKEINDIRWEWKLSSLKSASKKTDFLLRCSLTLNEATYHIKIESSGMKFSTDFINFVNIYEEKRAYKSYLMQDDIDKIVKLVSNYLIKEIKEHK